MFVRSDPSIPSLWRYLIRFSLVMEVNSSVVNCSSATAIFLEGTPTEGKLKKLELKGSSSGSVYSEI